MFYLLICFNVTCIYAMVPGIVFVHSQSELSVMYIFSSIVSQLI